MKKILILGCNDIGKSITHAYRKYKPEDSIVLTTKENNGTGTVIGLTEEEINTVLNSAHKELILKCKEISNLTGVSFEDLHSAVMKLQLSNCVPNLESLKDLKINFNEYDLKPKPIYDEPKSKYINKPKNNFKRR